MMKHVMPLWGIGTLQIIVLPGFCTPGQLPQSPNPAFAKATAGKPTSHLPLATRLSPLAEIRTDDQMNNE